MSKIFSLCSQRSAIFGVFVVVSSLLVFTFSSVSARSGAAEAKTASHVHLANCSYCNGDGYCHKCQGMGKINCNLCSGSGSRGGEACTGCDGKGGYDCYQCSDGICRFCGGSGTFQ